jgi:hypothetical protein
MRNREQGFGHVVAILAVVLVLVVGFTGWRVWDTNKKKQQKTDTTQTTSNEISLTTPQTNKKTYNDPIGKFSAEYPENWTLESEVFDVDKDYTSSKATLTSPSGTVLNLNSDWGGKGGGCEPAPGDTPFAAGNTCASWEYLASEDTDIRNVYYPTEVRKEDGSIEFTYENTADIQIVTMRFGNPNGSDQYLVGLRESIPTRIIQVNEPYMGFNISTLFMTVYGSKGEFGPYIYAYTEGDNEAFLSTPDVAAIKEILRTLRVNI